MTPLARGAKTTACRRPNASSVRSSTRPAGSASRGLSRGGCSGPRRHFVEKSAPVAACPHRAIRGNSHRQEAGRIDPGNLLHCSLVGPAQPVAMLQHEHLPTGPMEVHPQRLWLRLHGWGEEPPKACLAHGSSAWTVPVSGTSTTTPVRTNGSPVPTTSTRVSAPACICPSVVTRTRGPSRCPALMRKVTTSAASSRVSAKVVRQRLVCCASVAGSSTLSTSRNVTRCRSAVSDHRGPNSQPIDFQGVEIYPVLTAKIENTEKSNT